MNVLIVDSNSKFLDILKSKLSQYDSIEKIITFNSYEQLIVYLKDNKILFDITIINIDIDKKSINTLVTKYRFKNIIALSSNNKDIIRYSNYPYIQKILKSQINLNDLIKYIELSFNLKVSSKQFDNCTELYEIFSNLGFNISHIGTQYLIESILFSQEYDYKSVKSIYESISKMHDIDATKVEWSIYNSINYACKQKRASTLSRYLNIYDGRKPSSKYIIDFFAKTHKIC